MSILLRYSIVHTVTWCEVKEKEDAQCKDKSLNGQGRNCSQQTRGHKLGNQR